MGKKSKDKGDNYERKIAKIFSEWSGLDLRRTPLSGGWAEEADVTEVNQQRFPLSIECKKQEGWNFDQIIKGTGIWYDWLIQAEVQSRLKTNRLNYVSYPFLIFSKNFMPDYICLTSTIADAFNLVDTESPVLCIANDKIAEKVNFVVDRYGYVIILLENFLGDVSYKNLLFEIDPYFSYDAK